MIQAQPFELGQQLIGTSLGPYQIISQVGRGGTAYVYKAYHPQLARYFALKVLTPQHAMTEDFSVRFAREVRILRQLDHPHILPVTEIGQARGCHYLVMPFIEGGTLKEKLAQEPLNLSTIATLTAQIAAALDHAHRRGVIHRDVKPSNVLLDAGDQIRLTDFGLTKMMSEEPDDLTTTGLMIGTPAYISPEQGEGLPVDHHTDIYALGVMLFQMIAGHLPFQAKTAMAIIFKQIHSPIPSVREINPALPVEIQPVINRAMAKDIDDRYHSAGELARDFRQAIQAAPMHIRVAPTHGVHNEEALETTSNVPHNLPIQQDVFVGRANELARINACLHQENCRRFSLIGPGGIGKTRLAIEAARRLLDSSPLDDLAKAAFKDGVYFIPLASLPTVDQLIPAIAEALHLPFTEIELESPQIQLQRHLRDKKMLLILDNFEHLRAGTRVLHEITQDAPAVKLLITSRERLNLPNERTLEISGLPYPPSRIDTKFESYEAVQLFLENARRMQPSYRLPETDQAGLLRICQLVDGMPLGLELASSWIRILSCTEIAAEIAQNLDFLSGASYDLPERHQSLRAVFQQSWNRLTEIERIILRKLSIFRGSFQAEAAGTVAGASALHLTALTDKSFLRHGVGDRYEIHEVLRQFAEAKLHELPREVDQTKLYFLTYYAAFLQKRAGDLKENQQRRALQEIAVEIENIRQAWNWMIEGGHTVEIGQALDGLYQFCVIRSWLEEGVDLFGRAARRLREQEGMMHDFEPGPGVVYSKLLARQGIFHRRLQDYGRARELLQKGLIIARYLDNQAEIAFCLNQLGNIARLLGEIDEAKTLYEEGLTLYRQLNDQSGIATMLRNLGLIAPRLNGSAQQFHRESLSIFQSLGDEWGIARTLNELGKVTCGTGNYQEAQSLYEQSLTISQEIEDPAGILQALINLGEVACLTGDPAIAKEHLQTALALSRKTNNRQAMVQVLVYLGQTALLTQSHDEARNFFQQSLMLSRKINDDHGAATAFGHLGRLATEMGAYPTARDYFIEALRLTSKQSAVPQLLELLIGFANLLSAKAEAHHAVELIAGIEPYLPPNQPLAVELADLRARLAQTLPPDDFASAFERGQSDSLEGMVARLVAAA